MKELKHRRLRVLHLDLMELEEMLKSRVPIKINNPLPEDAKIVGMADVPNRFCVRLFIESAEYLCEYSYHIISECPNVEFERVEEEEDSRVTACCKSADWEYVNLVRCGECGGLLGEKYLLEAE